MIIKEIYADYYFTFVFIFQSNVHWNSCNEKFILK